MSVWIICDADPDCDAYYDLEWLTHADLDDFKRDILPDGWKGIPRNAYCPDHASLHVPF